MYACVCARTCAVYVVHVYVQEHTSVHIQNPAETVTLSLSTLFLSVSPSMELGWQPASPGHPAPALSLLVVVVGLRICTAATRGI